MRRKYKLTVHLEADDHTENLMEMLTFKGALTLALETNNLCTVVKTDLAAQGEVK